MNQYAIWNKSSNNWAAGNLNKTLRSNLTAVIAYMQAYKKVNPNMQYCIIRLSDNRILMEL